MENDRYPLDASRGDDWRNNMKKKAWLVHVSMTCQDCGKEFEDYLNGQAVAAKHAKDHKHLVTGEIGLAVRYDGKQ